MTTLVADFQERNRVVYTARNRSFVNVRESLEDGPIGFTSSELLLIAVTNCSLGTLTNHPLVQEAGFDRARASVAAEHADDPPRITRITIETDLWVNDASLADRIAALEEISCTCPMCNTLAAERQATVRVHVAEPA